VHNQGGVGVGASVEGAIVAVVLEDNDLLSSGELLFRVTSVGLLFLPSEGGGTLVRTGLVQGLAHSSHDGMRHGHSVVLLPLSDDGGDLLLLGREVGGDARHGLEDGGGWGGGGRRRTLGLGQR
jgi:hypothetical protein